MDALISTEAVSPHINTTAQPIKMSSTRTLWDTICEAYTRMHHAMVGIMAKVKETPAKVFFQYSAVETQSGSSLAMLAGILSRSVTKEYRSKIEGRTCDLEV